MSALAEALAVLRTPALLLVLAVQLWLWFQIKFLRRDLHQHFETLRKDLNGMGAKINRIVDDEKLEASKTRIAVAGLAGKVGAPEVLQEFLR